MRVNPAWKTWNDDCVQKIAETILDKCLWSRLPILADAIEDAGCDDEEVIQALRDHDICRGPRTWNLLHVLASKKKVV